MAGQSKPIHFQSTDGFKLHGEYYTKGKKAPGILMVHMCNVGDRTHFRELAQMMSQGFNILLFDFRGHGESKTIEFDVLKDRDSFWEKENNMILEDITSAYKYLVDRAEVDSESTALIGASCTVDRVLQLASNQKNVKALVLLSGNAHKKRLDYVKASGIAIFGIAASDDGEGIAAKWIEKILAASPNTCNKKRIYETGGHGTELFESKKELKKEVGKWLSALLNEKK